MEAIQTALIQWGTSPAVVYLGLKAVVSTALILMNACKKIHVLVMPSVTTLFLSSHVNADLDTVTMALIAQASGLTILAVGTVRHQENSSLLVWVLQAKVL